jgi:hypothetical protein
MGTLEDNEPGDEALAVGYDEPASVSPYAGLTDYEIYTASVKAYLTTLAERTLDLERLGISTADALAANVTVDILGFFG